MSRVAALLSKDVRGIARDPFLFFLLLYGAVLALAMRLAEPWLPGDAPLYLAPAAPFIGSLLAGTVLGFALIEERESGTLQLMRVVPKGARVQAIYLIGATLLLSLVSALLCTALYGRPIVRPELYAPLILVVALGGPTLMLFYGALASNKIEGLAMGKMTNVVIAVPILLFLVPASWHWTLYWSPWTWLYLGLLRAHATDAELAALGMRFPSVPEGVYWLIPLVVCSAVCAAFGRRLRRVVQ
jgi:fluoroquinolone transport system permease protein